MLIVLLLAVLTDFWQDAIPNSLILVGIVLALCYQANRTGVYGILQAIFGMAVPVAFLFVLFRIGTMGAGDIKLLAVTGAFLGLQDSVFCMIIAFVIGAVFSLIKMCVYGNYVTRMQHFAGYVVKTIQNRRMERYEHAKEPGSSIRFSLPVLLSVLVICLERGGGFFE